MNGTLDFEYRTRLWWNGRHDTFRAYWAKARGGSNPLSRID